MKIEYINITDIILVRMLIYKIFQNVKRTFHHRKDLTEDGVYHLAPKLGVIVHNDHYYLFSTIYLLLQVD